MSVTVYAPLSRFFHWLIAVFIVANFFFGLSLGELPLSPVKLQRITWHKWIGITILLLVSLRLINRLFSPPPLPEPAPNWQIRSSTLVHLAMYFLMFAIPFSGWCISSAAGIPVVYLNLWELPALLPKNKVWVDGLKELHESLNIAMAGLVLVHVVAAFKHHLIDRDMTLVRMLPILRRRP
ncbi:MAG: cytochrome b [Thiobacillaceae bacterium]